MSDLKNDMKNEDYQVEVSSNSNAEPLETKFACRSSQRNTHNRNMLTPHSARTMGGRENLLEGHDLLHDPELGSIERRIPATGAR
jgi:hypothetical protein